MTMSLWKGDQTLNGEDNNNYRCCNAWGQKNNWQGKISLREIQRLCNLKKIYVIPVVLEALGSVTMNFEKYVDKIGIKIDLHTAQKNTLLGKPH